MSVKRTFDTSGLRNSVALNDVELSIAKAYLKSMKVIRNYLVLCLLLLMSLSFFLKIELA